MLVLYRQPLTVGYWADMIVQDGSSFYTITQYLLDNDAYPFLGDLTWDNFGQYRTDAPLQGVLGIEVGSTLITYRDGRIGTSDGDIIGTYPHGADTDRDKAITFANFHQAKEWFLTLDPVPILTALLL